MKKEAILEILKDVGILLGCLLLIFLAGGTVALLVIPALIWLIIVSVKNENRKARDIVAGVANFFVELASSIDKFGNCALGGFFNYLFLIEGKYKFGKNHETVSAVIGWSYKLEDLNKGGLILRKVVNWLDFTKEDHCEDARLTTIKRAEETLEAVKLLN